MPDFDHVTPGDPLHIGASTWNAMIDAAAKINPEYLGKDGMGKLQSQVTPCTVVMVRNDSGADRGILAVLAVNVIAPLIDISVTPQLANQKPFFSGQAPAASTDAFVVMLDPAVQGAFGRGVLLGAVCVDVNVTNAGHGYAAPASTDTAKLTSATNGPALIVYKPTGTGTKRCEVLLCGQAGTTGPTGAPGGTITVETVGGGTVVSSVATLFVDPTDGFSLSSPAGGQARIDLLSATASQAGIVDTATQHFAGYKYFGDGINIGELASPQNWQFNPGSGSVLSGGSGGTAWIAGEILWDVSGGGQVTVFNYVYGGTAFSPYFLLGGGSSNTRVASDTGFAIVASPGSAPVNGITATKTVSDGTSTHTVTIQGGIITGWT